MPAQKKGFAKKIIISVTALLLILGAVMWYAGPALVERRLNRLDLAALFKKSTGGNFTSDDLQMDLLPLPHVVIPNAQVDIPGQLKGQWQNLAIYPSLSALLTGNLQIGRMVVEAPDFEIVVPQPNKGATAAPSSTGQAVFSLLPAGLPEPTASIRNAAVEITNGRFRIDGVSRNPIQIEGLDLGLRLPPDDMTIDLRCRSNMWKTLHLSGVLDIAAFKGQLQLTIGQLNPVALRQQLPQSPLQWDGKPMDVTARIDLSDRDRGRMTLQADLPRIHLKRGTASVAVRGISLESELVYSPGDIRVSLERLHADQPRVELSGQATVHSEAPLYQVELTGRHLSIAPLRQASLALAGDDETVAGIFDVLRDGSVPWIRFSTRGKQLEDMAVFRNMTITGAVEKGHLFIPGANLDLTDVYGNADISQGILKGDALKASYAKSRGSNGRLWLDLDQEEDVPFFLEIDVDADLKPLPSLLAVWVDDAVFKEEMRRIESLSGTADGRLILDGRSADLDVTVDVGHCRFDAQYDRLPSTLSVAEGMVQYTKDRIQVIHMSGKLGPSNFVGLTGHVAFGDTPLIQVDHAAARLDLDQIIPWLDENALFENQPFSLSSRQGKLNFDRLEMDGPLMHPDQWRFSIQGSAQGVQIASPALPGVADIKTAGYRASNRKIEIPDAHIQMVDADLRLQKSEILLDAYSAKTVALRLNGKIGPEMNRWIGDRIDMGKPWRLKPPVTVAEANLNWSDDGKQSFLGEMTTGGGTHVSLDVTMEKGRFRRQKVAVKDQDSQAELLVAYGPEKLDIDYKGNITAATIGRMMQENRYARGHMEGQFQAHIFLQQPGRSIVTGTLKAYDIRQPLRLERSFSIDELSLDAENNTLHLRPAVFEIDHQIHRVTGSIAVEDTGFVLDLVHRAANVSLTLPETGSADHPPSEAGRFSFWDLPLRGRIISRIGSLSLNRFQWSPFNATAQISKKRWQYRIEEAKMCGIDTPGNILVTPESVSISFSPAAKDAPLEGTMTCLIEKPNLIDGQFDVSGHLETRGPIRQLDQVINGHVELKARKGRIYRFNLLSKTLAVVNLTEIFRGKIPDLMQGGLAYESLDIQVDIQDSVCTIKQAVIDGASADIAGQGTVNLLTGETDMVVLVAPFKTIDAIVKYTPIIGDWLGGTLVSIPVKVSGPFEDPTVTPLSPSAVGSSLMNLMKNTIQLPVKIVAPFWKGTE